MSVQPTILELRDAAERADAATRCGVCGTHGDHGARVAELEGRAAPCPTGLTRAQARGPLRDRDGDVWLVVDESTMTLQAGETMRFTLWHVHTRWGPLTPVTDTPAPDPVAAARDRLRKWVDEQVSDYYDPVIDPTIHDDLRTVLGMPPEDRE